MWLQRLFKEKKLWGMVALLVALLVGYVWLPKVNISEKPESSYPTVDIPSETSTVKLLVESVEPKPDQTDVSTAPTIKIYFDRPIENLVVKIDTNPAFKFNTKLSGESYHAILTPTESLKPGTKYEIRVILEKKTIYSWSFTTGNANTPAKIVEEIKSELPTKGSHYAISYWATSDSFAVTIDAEPYEKYRAEAIAWFKARGLTDPEKQINIVFIPVGKAAD